MYKLEIRFLQGCVEEACTIPANFGKRFVCDLKDIFNVYFY